MATPKRVNGQVLDGSGNGVAGIVVAKMLSLTYVNAGEVVPREVRAIAAADGTYSFDPAAAVPNGLFSNADLTPANTYWSITEVANGVPYPPFGIVVPNTAGPFVMNALVVSSPALPAQYVTGPPGPGVPNPLTTPGSLIVGGAAGVQTEYLAGASGRILTANGAGVAPTWQPAAPSGVTSITSGPGIAVSGTAGVPIVGINQGALPNALTGAPPLVAWYKADALALADGAAVSTWADSSGNAHDLLQATGAQQPVFKSTTSVPWFNGNPTVRFSGTKWMIASGTGLPAGAAWSWAAVVYVDPSAGGDRSVMATAGTANLYLFWQSTQRPVVAAGSATTQILGGQYASNGSVFVCVAIYDGAQLHLYLNDRLATYGAVTGNVTPGSIIVGALSLVGYGPWVGDIGEAMLFQAALTQAQRVQLTRYLGSKWGIGVAAPF